jgi:hypothetical protein
MFCFNCFDAAPWHGERGLEGETACSQLACVVCGAKIKSPPWGSQAAEAQRPNFTSPRQSRRQFTNRLLKPNLGGGRRIRARGPSAKGRLWAATPGKHCRFGPEPVSGSAFRAAVSDWQRPAEPFAGAGPMVRIRFPPVESPCLAGFRPLTSKSRAFPAGVRGGAGSAVGRDGRGAVIWRRRAAMSLSGQIPVPQRG